jgi:hypothetical protein
VYTHLKITCRLLEFGEGRIISPRLLLPLALQILPAPHLKLRHAAKHALLTRDTTGGIMNRKKIAKLRRELAELRAGKYNLKRSDIVSFAQRVGRRPDTSRGKEPTYVSVFPQQNPLSIPGHSTINPFTALKILDVLEADLDKWEDLLEEQERKEDANSKKLPPATVRTDRDPSGK